MHVLVLVLEMPSVKTGRQGFSSERLAGREFTLPDIQRKPLRRGKRLQNDPNAVPRPITVTSANKPPTIDTMTMSK